MSRLEQENRMSRLEQENRMSSVICAGLLIFYDQ